MATSDLIEQMCGEMTMADCDRCQKQVEPRLHESVPVFAQCLTRLFLATNQGSLLQCDLLLVYSDLCLVRGRVAKRVLMVTDWSNLCAINANPVDA
jgi:hypothetical protein